jgi:hypothetical protein
MRGVLTCENDLGDLTHNASERDLAFAETVARSVIAPLMDESTTICRMFKARLFGHCFPPW